MKKLICILFLIISFVLFSETTQIDLYNYDFFGFKMNNTQDEIIKELNKQNKKFEIKNPIMKDNIGIFPVGFDQHNKIHVDFVFSLYKGKVLSFGKYNIDKSFLEKFLKEIKNYNTIPQLEEWSKEYRFGDFIITYQEINKGDAKNLIIIQNIKVRMELWEKQLETETDYPVYKVKENNVKMFALFNPSMLIRNLNKDEKVQVTGTGKSDKVDGKEGKWLEVNTGLGEIGNIFSIYLEEIKKNNSSIAKKFYKSTIDNLRFRETPTLDGKFIRLLTKGEKLEFMEKGKEETVNGVKGTWVKVKTEKGEVGWAFDAYLEEVK